MKVNLDITRRQHYVWRNYLRPWSLGNDKIVCYLKDKDKIIESNLMNLAQERYFYKFTYINEKEKLFLDYSLEKTKGPIKEIIKDLLQGLYLFNELKDINTEVNKFTKSTAKNKAFESLEKNGFEGLHTYFEKEGFELIACRTLDDLKKFETYEFKYKALFYLCIQYFRTKKRKDSVSESFKNEDIDAENIYNIMAIILALQVTQNISFDSKINYSLLEIKSKKSFIVGDQPVINLHSEKLDKDGNVSDLAFYYPLSPKHSIKIEFDDKEEKYNLINPSDEEIDFYNKKMLNESHLFLFADNESTIKNYT